MVNDKLRADNVYLSAWDIGVNVRIRFEDKEDAGFTDAGSNWDFSLRPQDDNNNHYSLLRTIEDSLGLPPLTNNDRFAQPMNEYWV